MATYDDMLKSARQQAFFQGLMGLGAGMLQGGDPRQPQSFGAGLGRGLQGFNQSMNDGFANQMQSEMMRIKMADMDRQRQMQDRQQGAMATLMGGMDPRTGINWNTGRAGMSPQQEMALLAQASPETALQLMYPAPPKPPASVQEYEYARGNGYEGSYADFLQSGKPTNAPPANLQEWAAFQNMSPQDQERFLAMKRANPYFNIGGSMVQPSQTQPGTLNAEIPKTLPPEQTPEVKGAQTTATAQAQAEVDASTAAVKKATGAESTLNLLDGVDGLIDQSSGGMLDVARDKSKAVFGESTPGAQAIAELKVIQAALMTAMPRMEGPQSDRDVQLYREAAGQIADPMVPRETRKAAVRTIRRIQEKYVSGRSVQPSGTLTAAERAELEALRKELGR